ncbi:hypothetical protein BT63DRAFT_54129 [Microthyrium microscopicum]|uniref:RBR-type E3 ubiquitin transferase n=1 Tax=Microthyrium microscopicum TaxID=703497 RepID=A0A6A6U3U5_9PEZI|nr:hypothetical protein BT63DRAFT_54129 [Microthyrium microscopicum]
MTFRLNEDAEDSATVSVDSIVDTEYVKQMEEFVATNGELSSQSSSTLQVDGLTAIAFQEEQRVALDALTPLADCEVCSEAISFHQRVRLPCGHIFCVDCTLEYFRRATKDEVLYPPMCCTRQISLLLIRKDMPDDLSRAYEKAKLEFATLDRTYCANPACGQFVPPTFIVDQQATCSHCDTVTHATARDKAMEATQALADLNGWKTCYQCNRIVELNFGCYHMTCPCKAEFCYLCGAKWKTCDCSRWNEDRLLGPR